MRQSSSVRNTIQRNRLRHYTVGVGQETGESSFSGKGVEDPHNSPKCRSREGSFTCPISLEGKGTLIDQGHAHVSKLGEHVYVSETGEHVRVSESVERCRTSLGPLRPSGRRDGRDERGKGVHHNGPLQGSVEGLSSRDEDQRVLWDEPFLRLGLYPKPPTYRVSPSVHLEVEVTAHSETVRGRGSVLP